MLTDSHNISDTTKTEPFELFFCLNDLTSADLCCADLTSISDPFTSWLSISFLTRGFLGI